MKRSIGQRIKTIRESMDMNKEQFSKMIGISGQYLGMCERREMYAIYRKIKSIMRFNWTIF